MGKEYYVDEGTEMGNVALDGNATATRNVLFNDALNTFYGVGPLR